MKRALLLLLLGAVALPCAARAADSLPDEVVLPSSLQLKAPVRLYAFGEGLFTVAGQKAPADERGRYTHGDFKVTGLGLPKTAKEVWMLMRPGLARVGWTFLLEADGAPFRATLKFQTDVREVWAQVEIHDAGQLGITVVEVGPQDAMLALPSPAATPEKLDDRDDFPYLPHYPGSTLQKTFKTEGPLDVAIQPGAPEWMGAQTVSKSYQRPSDLSTLQFVLVYKDALQQAGWSVPLVRQGVGQPDARLLAHYTKNGRDLWASLRIGADILFTVADVGSGARL